MKKKLIVEKEFEGKRLDLYLAFKLQFTTRSQIKKLIKENSVEVNARVEYKANYKVVEGDIVEVEYTRTSDPLENIEPEPIDLDIVYEDEQLLAIDKEPGMVVHPATGNYSGTMINALLYKYRNLENVGDTFRAGLVNRIDKDTSGLVLVGKTNRALWFYSKQFAQRQIKKQYLAVVVGDISSLIKKGKDLEVENYIARNPKSRKKFAVVDQGKGRIAKSKISLIALSKDKKYSFVLVKPQTGRTHQIRVHLQYLGFPIVGDPVYSSHKYSRLLLHSYKIRLSLLSGKTKIIKTDPKGEFVNFLREHFEQSAYEKFVKTENKKKARKKTN